jgi:hypothetical protein
MPLNMILLEQLGIWLELAQTHPFRPHADSILSLPAPFHLPECLQTPSLSFFWELLGFAVLNSNIGLQFWFLSHLHIHAKYSWFILTCYEHS